MNDDNPFARVFKDRDVYIIKNSHADRYGSGVLVEYIENNYGVTFIERNGGNAFFVSDEITIVADIEVYWRNYSVWELEFFDPNTVYIPPEQMTNSAYCIGEDFEMLLYTDKAIYKTTDIVQVWATLEYIGDEDAITIWSSDPFMSFYFTDGKDFINLGTAVNDVLKSTELERGKVYRFDYQKNVSWDENAPDADFWREYAKDPLLRLPAGTYTIILNGVFGLTENATDYLNGLFCELKIEVVE